MMKKIRLNKFLALCGLASRRKAEDFIQKKLIKVNEKTITDLSCKVDPLRDIVKMKGRILQLSSNKSYYLFNKPKQVLTTMQDPLGRPTVADFIRKSRIKKRVFPVGRLDWDSEGLLILTDDGDLSYQITHPKYKILKTYWVKLNREPSSKEIRRLLSGVSIHEGKVKAQSLKFLRKNSRTSLWMEITIQEGKKNQIKQMFRKIDCDVKKLKRISVGGLKLSKIRIGQIRPLTKKELSLIFYKKS